MYGYAMYSSELYLQLLLVTLVTGLHISVNSYGVCSKWNVTVWTKATMYDHWNNYINTITSRWRNVNYSTSNNFCCSYMNVCSWQVHGRAAPSNHRSQNKPSQRNQQARLNWSKTPLGDQNSESVKFAQKVH